MSIERAADLEALMAEAAFEVGLAVRQGLINPQDGWCERRVVDGVEVVVSAAKAEMKPVGQAFFELRKGGSFSTPLVERTPYYG